MPDLPASTPKGRWIWGIFSESDGTASFGRVGSALALIVFIAWVTYLVLHNRALPSLSDGSVFITAPYAVNKLATSFGKANQ